MAARGRGCQSEKGCKSPAASGQRAGVPKLACRAAPRWAFCFASALPIEVARSLALSVSHPNLKLGRTPLNRNPSSFQHPPSRTTQDSSSRLDVLI
ncbi:hypothetical protein IE81DRAFT_176751 [Ceraceosorus guamensis]|uniref:Uncharacterized protein n=1 Tax=Ceraceosorus guamensis TaxID=1522189 RepID=A0A316VYG8_9BASI|nr:hypothetical protein IE81DRAFT_176751 [Ceraceosorus guamensis]PWN41443.1 hypothetical protein IE81DRAFT_176751 [Ceraceosorus guamensis]